MIKPEEVRIVVRVDGTDDVMRRLSEVQAEIAAEEKEELAPVGTRYCQITYSPEDQPFIDVIEWLWLERERHQTAKWDYGNEDAKHALEGLDDGSWFWDRGVLNYAGRVRLHGVTSPLGLQALLKLAATIISMPEHLLREGHVTELPRPGLSSGNLE